MEMLGDNRIEDVRWLCSLLESDLDILVKLKEMVIQRASFIRHESLANNFDLKKLIDLSFLLMQVQKQQLCEIPQMKESAHGCVERLNVARHEISEEFREMGAEELMAYISSDRQKKISELFGDDSLIGKKKKRVGYAIVCSF
ncbi:uncharacterized protein LOC111881389 [Lactuca sativa]|uniref:uncharacterized protein LOC111881389 n=1 Tax=Lactuca sativa TaxID=4236 RepID=UPI000CA8C072|nr:uncharacterized protein LOC111881389 [Lactuca sativa]